MKKAIIDANDKIKTHLTKLDNKKFTGTCFVSF